MNPNQTIAVTFKDGVIVILGNAGELVRYIDRPDVQSIQTWIPTPSQNVSDWFAYLRSVTPVIELNAS